MSNKPETTYTRAVHNRLKKLGRVYAEKMNNPYRSGTADVWYSGARGDLWVEYKFIERIPRSKSILPDLTPRQKLWLNSRFDEGRNVAVVLGTPTGGVIYRNKDWMLPMTDIELSAQILSNDDIARWILDQVGATKCLLFET